MPGCSRSRGDDPGAANARFGERWGAWWRARTGDAVGAEPWHASDRLNWFAVPAMTYWEQWGDPRFASFNGMVWMRKRVTLTAAEAAQAATLSLGVIDELDQTFVNGVAVGNRFSWEAPRDYAVPRGMLHAGVNEILVNIFDGSGAGGFAGPAERLHLTFADGAVKPLGEGWQYSVAHVTDLPPRAPWDEAMGLSFIYNGMIAPLGDYGLSGVAWYQGEADVGLPGSYADRLGAMMATWRRQFGRPDLPFLIVSLANFGPFATHPVESGWAALREQQRLAAMRDPHVASGRSRWTWASGSTSIPATSRSLAAASPARRRHARLWIGHSRPGRRSPAPRARQRDCRRFLGRVGRAAQLEQQFRDRARIVRRDAAKLPLRAGDRRQP